MQAEVIFLEIVASSKAAGMSTNTLCWVEGPLFAAATTLNVKEVQLVMFLLSEHMINMLERERKKKEQLKQKKVEMERQGSVLT